MEVLGAIASTLALVEAGLKLKQCILNIPTHRRRLVEVVTNICRDLDFLHEFAQNPRWRHVNAPPEFCDAITSLNADLEMALTKCQKLSNHTWWAPITNWRNRDDTELELIQIERKIAQCHQRFSTSSLARVELSLADFTHMTDQFRQEVFHRLNFVEEHLKAKAEGDLSDGGALVGVSSLSGPAIQKALDHTREELVNGSPDAVEYRYLHLKVDTLIRVLHSENKPFQGQPPSSAPAKTHYATSEDPTGQREDAVLETMRIIRVLRTGDASTPSTEFASNLEDLAIGLLDLGLYEDARQMYGQVLRIYRGFIINGGRLAVVDAMVARALVGVSTCLMRLGQLSEALHSIREAVSIFTALEEAHPGDYKHGLALTLNNLANYLRDSGDHKTAKDTIDKALAIRRDLAKELPEVYKPDLAASLLNASTCYSKLCGFEHKALIIIDEAVSLSRELASANPALFQAHLGAALHNMANCRAGLDNLLAYENIREAVVIRRGLAAKRPLVFGPGFARSLRVAKELAKRCGDMEAGESFHREWLTLRKPGDEGIITADPIRLHSPVVYDKTLHLPNPTTMPSEMPFNPTILPSEMSPFTRSVFNSPPFDFIRSAYTSETAIYHVISPAYRLNMYPGHTKLKRTFWENGKRQM